MTMDTLHPWKRKVFIDTEFSDLDAPVLLSIAMVAEDGAEFYAEMSDFNTNNCSEFVRTFVIPQFGQYPDRVMSLHEASSQLCTWMGKLKTSRQRPAICYDYPMDGPVIDSFNWKTIGGMAGSRTFQRGLMSNVGNNTSLPMAGDTMLYMTRERTVPLIGSNVGPMQRATTLVNQASCGTDRR